MAGIAACGALDTQVGNNKSTNNQPKINDKSLKNLPQIIKTSIKKQSTIDLGGVLETQTHPKPCSTCLNIELILSTFLLEKFMPAWGLAQCAGPLATNTWPHFVAKSWPSAVAGIAACGALDKMFFNYFSGDCFLS